MLRSYKHRGNALSFQLKESNRQVLHFGINPNWIFFSFIIFFVCFVAREGKKNNKKKERVSVREKRSRCRVICAAAVALVLHINGLVMINRGCVMFLH